MVHFALHFVYHIYIIAHGSAYLYRRISDIESPAQVFPHLENMANLTTLYVYKWWYFVIFCFL